MKKSNCKRRLVAAAGLFGRLASLGYALVPIVVYGQLFELELPKIAITKWVFTALGRMLFPVACANMFTMLLVFMVLAATRKNNTAFIVVDHILLAVTTAFFAALTYGYYKMELSIYTYVSAGLTICAFVAFVLNFVALRCKDRPAKACAEECQSTETDTQPLPQSVEEQAQQPEPQQEDATEPAVDAVTQRQLARLQTLLDKGVINQNQYEKLVAQFTNKN